MALKAETIQSLGDAADRIYAPLPKASADGGRQEGEGPALLAWLGVGRPLSGPEAADLANLLRFARKLDRIFEIPAPDAPGLHCFGAEVSSGSYGAIVDDKASVSGVGGDRLSAFRACVAEAAEFVCQFETEDDERATAGSRTGDAGDFEELLGKRAQELADPAGRPWVASRNAKTGSAGLLPAALCFRRSRGRRPNGLAYAMGLGVGAGRDREEAGLHAVLEWVERDAVALWWRGGSAPAAIEAEALAASGAMEKLRRYRGELRNRRTWFLDLTSDLGVPVAAALSVDGDGRDFAYGFSAATTIEAAVTRAFEELLQIELADRLVAAKRREAGDAALNETDRGHVARAGLVASDWPALQPAGMARARRKIGISPDAAAAKDQLRALGERLAECGHPIHLVDLTRADIGVAVVRAVIPGLQPDPADLVTRRLAERRQLSRMSQIPADRVALY